MPLCHEGRDADQMNASVSGLKKATASGELKEPKICEIKGVAG